MSPTNTTAKTGAKTTPKAARPEKPLRTRVGKVTGDGRDKTRTVLFEATARHPKYGKYLRTQTNVQVHDAGNESRAGDLVEVAQCRPMSRTKTWRLVRVVGKRQEA